MVLISFSIRDHISKIKDGSKSQTTRKPRKPRSNGKTAYSVGDKVQLYSRSRLTPSCKNCLDTACYDSWKKSEPIKCTHHTNFFGESEILDIIHYHSGDYKERYHEVWMGHTLELATKEDKDLWAKADGFPKGYIQAHDWFKATTGNPNWADQNLDVIVWQKDEIVKKWKTKPC